MGVALLLATAVVVAYLPALDAGFINWDDPRYVVENAHIRRFDWGMVRWAFSDAQAAGIWHPITWLSLALDYSQYGTKPWGYHLTNVLLHAGNTALLFLVWYRMTTAWWPSIALAALFGLHPMHVESVAWVTERKDVLSAFFWILAMAAHVRSARMGTLGARALVVVLGGLAMLAKPMAVTLPIALVLLDHWPLARSSRRTLFEQVPLAVVALAVTMTSILVGGEAIDATSIGIGARLANAIVSYVRYLGLTFWPVGLSPWYPHPALEGPPLSIVGVASAAGLLIAITAAVVREARRRPYLLFGWAWFLVTLLPAMGLVQAGRQGMADRFAYLPHVGVFAAVVWGMRDLPIWEPIARRRTAAVVVMAILALLGGLSFAQTRIWQSNRTFWEYTARTSPYSFVAYQALGGVLFHEGRSADAFRVYRRAIKLRPGVPLAHERTGLLAAQLGKPGLAAAQYRKLVDAQPNDADAHYRLAKALLAQGHRNAARRHLERVLALEPGHRDARGLLASTS